MVETIGLIREGVAVVHGARGFVGVQEATDGGAEAGAAGCGRGVVAAVGVVGHFWVGMGRLDSGSEDSGRVVGWVTTSSHWVAERWVKE